MSVFDKPGSGAVVPVASFSLRVDDQELGPFAQLAGISTEVEQTEYMEAGKAGPELGRLVGRAKPPTVVLRRSLTTRLELWAWHETVRAGMPTARKNCSVALLDPEGRPVVRYELTGAWPSKLEISSAPLEVSARAGEREALIETVTLLAEDIRVKA